jgi:flagellar motor switch/type III secretory pathway protein FliN
MRAHPYRLIGERLQRSLIERFNPILQGWAEDWLPDGTSYTIVKLTPFSDYCREAPSTDVYRLVSWVDDNWCGLLEPVETALFGAMLLNASDDEIAELSSSVLLHNAAQQALLELAQRVLTRDQPSYENVPFFTTANQFPVNAKLCGSGAIVLQIKIATHSLDYIVSPLTVERYIEAVDPPPGEKRKQLDEFSSAIGNQKIGAQVVLGSAELSLAELSTIRVGDVVTLDSCIDQPASIRFGLNGDGCEGFIGIKRGRLAFRISQVEHRNKE